MKIVILLLVIALGATLAAGLYFRSVTLPAEVWHVDPAAATPPGTPNFDLRAGAQAARFDLPPQEVAARLDAVTRQEGASAIAGDLDGGHVTYVMRSRLMGFPDAVSVRLHTDGDGTRMDIFSRSRFGQSDLGVNTARVDRWVDAIRAISAP